MQKIKLAYIKQSFISDLSSNFFVKYHKMYKEILAIESCIKN